MAGAQNKKHPPGAFKSCLIPYRKQIFTWWFDERRTAVEIQKRLQEEYGIEIHRTSITRFIKVRRNKPDPHERPPHLQIPETSPAPPPSKVSQTPKATKQPKKTIPLSNKEAEEMAEGERMLQELGNSTLQQLWQKEQNAKLQRQKKK